MTVSVKLDFIVERNDGEHVPWDLVETLNRRSHRLYLLCLVPCRLGRKSRRPL
jgi:hypothetical protein